MPLKPWQGGPPTIASTAPFGGRSPTAQERTSTQVADSTQQHYCKGPHVPVDDAAEGAPAPPAGVGSAGSAGVRPLSAFASNALQSALNTTVSGWFFWYATVGQGQPAQAYEPWPPQQQEESKRHCHARAMGFSNSTAYVERNMPDACNPSDKPPQPEKMSSVFNTVKGMRMVAKR